MKVLITLSLILLVIVYTGCILENDNGEISGQVTDAEDGSGIIDVSITTDPPTDAVITDVDGKYIIDGLSSGSYTVMAFKAGYDTANVEVFVEDERTATGDIVLTYLDTTEIGSIGIIIGKVTDALSEMGIEGVSITTTPPTGAVPTDSLGNYVIKNVEWETYTITAVKLGYKDNSVEISHNGDTTIADIPLTPDSTNIPPKIGNINCKVLDAANNTEVGDVNITTDPVTQSGATDSTGRYVIENVEWATYTVSAKKSGYKDNSVDVVLNGDSTIATIFLTAVPDTTPQKGNIICKVLDAANNTGIGGVNITTNPVTQSGVTDSTGRYVIENAEWATYTVSAEKSGYKDNSVDVVLNGDSTIATIFLTAVSDTTPQKGIIAGKVTNSTDGTNIFNVLITTNPFTESVLTDSLGDYTIENVNWGEYDITAEKSGFKSKTVGISVNSDTTRAFITLTADSASVILPKQFNKQK